MTEDFVIKYFWSAIGYGLMSIPIFFPAIGNSINQDTGNIADPVAARAEGELERPGDPGIELMGQDMSPTGGCYSLWRMLGVD